MLILPIHCGSSGVINRQASVTAPSSMWHRITSTRQLHLCRRAKTVTRHFAFIAVVALRIQQHTIRRAAQHLSDELFICQCFCGDGIGS